MSNYSKSKADGLRIFKDQSNSFPLWTLFELGKKNPIYSNMNEGDESKTIRSFETALNDLYPDKIYTVKMFKNLLHRKGGQKFISPNFEFSFQFERAEASPVNGVQGAQPQQQQQANPYGVDLTQRINLNDHVQLIQAKATAESQRDYWQTMYNDKVRECVKLESELKDLEEEFDELENEMKEMDQEAEAEEKAKLSGTEKETTIEGAIASVIKDNGGVLIENLFDKGVKGAPEFKEEQLEEKDNKAVNGTQTVSLDEITLDQLNERMSALNPKWKAHLYKMVLIGEQKPATFKMFMSKLENY